MADIGDDLQRCRRQCLRERTPIVDRRDGVGGAVQDEHGTGYALEFRSILVPVGDEQAGGDEGKMLADEANQAGKARDEDQSADPVLRRHLGRDARAERIADRDDPGERHVVREKPPQSRRPIAVEALLARRAGVAAIAAIFRQQDAIAAIGESSCRNQASGKAVTIAVEEDQRWHARPGRVMESAQRQAVAGRRAARPRNRVAERSGWRRRLAAPDNRNAAGRRKTRRAPANTATAGRRLARAGWKPSSSLQSAIGPGAGRGASPLRRLHRLTRHSP